MNRSFQDCVASSTQVRAGSSVNPEAGSLAGSEGQEHLPVVDLKLLG